MFYLVSQSDESVRTGIKDLDSVPINGFQVVEVPDFVQIDESVSPFDLAELNDQKYKGLLSSRPGYEHVTYDDLQDDSSVDKANSRAGGFYRGSVFLPPSNQPDGDGRLTTSTIDISSNGSFSEFSVYWDLYTVSLNETTRRTEKFYTPEDPDRIEMYLSNDGGSTYRQGLYSESVQFQSAGSDIRIEFENESTSTRFYVGSFGFLY
jgi:hypothetical protein